MYTPPCVMQNGMDAHLQTWFFPFFFLLSGFQCGSHLKKYGFELNGSSFLRISRRTLSIFALGLFLTIFPYFESDYSIAQDNGRPSTYCTCLWNRCTDMPVGQKGLPVDCYCSFLLAVLVIAGSFRW